MRVYLLRQLLEQIPDQERREKLFQDYASDLQEADTTHVSLYWRDRDILENAKKLDNELGKKLRNYSPVDEGTPWPKQAGTHPPPPQRIPPTAMGENFELVAFRSIQAHPRLRNVDIETIAQIYKDRQAMTKQPKKQEAADAPMPPLLSFMQKIAEEHGLPNIQALADVEIPGMWSPEEPEEENPQELGDSQ